MQVVFQTPRLTLRQFTVADAPLIFALNSDPEVLKYLHEPILKNEYEAVAIIENIILPQYKNNLGRWAIHLNDTNEFIGWCGLKHHPQPGEIDLGYRLKQSAWRKGYAFEAASHTLDHGFKKLHLPEIVGRAHIDNAGSLRILQKIGMRYISDGIVDGSPVKTFVAVNSAL